jgi:hypothetical protein
MVELGAAPLRPSATFGGRRVGVLPERQGFWLAVVGIGLAAHPDKLHTRSERAENGVAREIAIALGTKKYAEQRLTALRDTSICSPPELAGHEHERIHLREVWRRFSAPREADAAPREPG